MQNRIEDVYAKFGKDFCICPFLGGFYQSHRVVPKDQSVSVSTITPCSLTYWQHDTEFNVIDNSIEKSINSETWKKMRRAFVAGKYHEIPQCKICQDTERVGGQAARFGANQHFATNCHSVDLVAEIQQVIDNDYTASKLLSLDWFPSNYCNFSCVMCAGGASSSRLTFEIALNNVKQHMVQNELAHDFAKFIDGVEVINFTGGETVMQRQVVDMITQLAQQPSAKDKTIFLLTNASSYPEHLEASFKKFYRVIYMCSIDGVGPVIEYQRRNAVWSEVEANSLRLIHHDTIACVINYVLTSINVLSFMQFVDWIYDNNISRGITISPVFRNEYLGVSALPDTLRSQVNQDLEQGLVRYQSIDGPVARRCVELIETVQSVLRTTAFSPDDLKQFVRHIKKEDQVSVQPFVKVVPQWAPYFDQFADAV